MRSAELIKKIKNYAIVSFLVPLIAVNSCLFLYKLLGDIEFYSNYNWNKEKIEYTWKEKTILQDEFGFVNCPKYIPSYNFITTDNQIITIIDRDGDKIKEGLIASLAKEDKMQSIIIKKGEILNDRCVKNHKLAYFFLKRFNSLETLMLNAKINNTTGFIKIKNPYFYGEVSISRTARFFPAILIFKTLIILSAFLLFLYWKNNLKLLSELKNENILPKFSKIFFYLGVFSCIFLILHATFLGLDSDSKWFSKMRKLIIVSFIFFEVFAQIFLTKNLFKFREELKRYNSFIILKLKVIFVTVIVFITCVAFIFLALGDPSNAFKHILEWNYFSFLLIFYLLSRLLWK